MVLIHLPGRLTESGDPRYVFRAGAHAPLLAAAVDERLYLNPAVHIQKTDSFRSMNLMAADRE